ncbi:MAG: phage tail tube protein [Clostridiales bacterium]|jgi:hypothetical protein|nr:phage tail tube protein [Clostridiales bacterium]
MATLKAWDAINGAAGRCVATIGSDIEDMIYVKNIKAKVEKRKSEIKVLGQTGAKHKANGWRGTGTMTMYYATTLFRKMIDTYIRDGVDTYFQLLIENDDPSSEIGRQTIILKQVNINNIDIAKLDINSTELDEEIEFTFNDVEIRNEFNQVVGE